LGCLQVLDDEGVLRGDDRAEYISAVSGGSYAVGAAAVLQQGLGRPSEESDDELDLREDELDLREEELGPFAAGSPELDYLRTHLSYLTHGPGGVSSEVWQSFMGVFMNLVLFASAAAVIGSFAGWFYGWRVKTLRASTQCTTKQSCSFAIKTPSALAWIAIGLCVAAAAIGLLWVVRNWGPTLTNNLRIAAIVAALVAAGFAFFVIAMPHVLGWLVRSMAPKHDNPSGAGGIRHPWITIGGFGGLLVAIRGAMSEFKSLGLSDPRSGAGKLVRRFRGPLVSLLALIAVPLFFGGLLVLFMYREARQPAWINSSWHGVLFFVVPLALIVLVDEFGDVNNWSLHKLYKDRLHNAFFLERTSRATATTPGSAQERQGGLALSQLTNFDFPEVLICATSNLKKYGEVPTGLNAELFLLSAEKVGGEGVGERSTAKYETDRLRTWRDLTVMDAVSISGAAVSPLMGRMTRAPMRVLMALANIRLGVWLPRPDQKNDKKPPRRPNLWHLFDEAFGDGASGSRFVYVTDGGHYDNLGLVELLTRRCDWIWCVDASGEKIDSFSTIGEAVATAQAELRVSIDIAPEKMAPTPGSTYVKKPFCVGTITYPADENGPGKQGKLVIVKAGVTKNAPFAVRSYHANNPDFPCDSTIDQLYTADRFDAYLALGNFSMRAAFDATDYLRSLHDAKAGHQRAAMAPARAPDSNQPA
jgi:hypothetical protein